MDHSHLPHPSRSPNSFQCVPSLSLGSVFLAALVRPWFVNLRYSHQFDDRLPPTPLLSSFPLPPVPPTQSLYDSAPGSNWNAYSRPRTSSTRRISDRKIRLEIRMRLILSFFFLSPPSISSLTLSSPEQILTRSRLRPIVHRQSDSSDLSLLTDLSPTRRTTLNGPRCRSSVRPFVNRQLTLGFHPSRLPFPLLSRLISTLSLETTTRDLQAGADSSRSTSKKRTTRLLPPQLPSCPTRLKRPSHPRPMTSRSRSTPNPFHSRT